MKKIFLFLCIASAFVACTNKTAAPEEIDNRISLRTDTVNVVKMTDTLVIFESTCRGCAYEGSTQFDISDTSGHVKLEKIITTDDNSSDVAGGNISKTLVLVPVKPGTTTFKLYKTYGERQTSEDSARGRNYTVQIQN